MTSQQIPTDIFANPLYFGKHVIVIDHEVLVATTGDEAMRLLENVRLKHPDKKPILAYVPKEETLILFM